MKLYLLRALKYFAFCCVLAVAIVAALLLLGLADVRFNQPRELAAGFGTIAAMLALMAALYPKLTFTRRRVKGDLSPEGELILLNAFRSAGFEPVGEATAEVWHFRAKQWNRRLRRFFDDEIIVTQEADGWLQLDGHRTEVLRVLYHWDAFARGGAQRAQREQQEQQEQQEQKND